MASLPQYRIYPFSLAIGVPQDLQVSGRFIRVLAADERFNLSINGESPIPLQAGQALLDLGVQINRIQLTSTATATVDPNAIELAIGETGFSDDRLFLASSLQTTSASELRGALPDVVLVAATNTLVVPALATRRCVRITNTHATLTTRVCTDPADLTAGRGEPIFPGETREFFVTGVIYARSTGAGTLSFGEEVF